MDIKGKKVDFRDIGNRDKWPWSELDELDLKKWPWKEFYFMWCYPLHTVVILVSFLTAIAVLYGKVFG